MNVAVVIPVFNGEAWIGDTLESVLNQKYPSAEIVVVDDHSEDRSLEIAASYREVTAVRNPIKCAANARDHGLDRTKSDLVAFLDQDDLWSPTHLERLVNLLRENPEVPAVAARKQHFETESTLLFDDKCRLSSRALDPWKNIPFGSVDPSQVLLRRETLKRTGGYRKQTPLVADVQLYLAASLESGFLESEAVTVGKRDHDASLSHHLRTDQLDRYLSALLRCSEALIPLRLERCPDEATFLKRRLRLARALKDLAVSDRSNDFSLAMRSLTELQEILGNEEEGFRQVILDNFAWFFRCVPESGRRHRWLASLWSGLGNGPMDRLVAETLEEMLVSLTARQRLQCLGAAPGWRQKRRLLTAFRDRRSTERSLPSEGRGIDDDGWMQDICHLDLGPNFKSRGLALTFEVPPWLKTTVVEVEAFGHVSRKQLVSGCWRLRIPNNRAGPRRIRIVHDSVAEIPDDGRTRGCRLVDCKAISKVSAPDWDRVLLDRDR